MQNGGPESAEHAVELALGQDETLAAVAQAAEMWGAGWRREGSGGRLALPVTAGLRHGRLDGRVRTEPASGRGTRLVFRVETTRWHLHWRAVVILMIGAGGALTLTLWPFFPPLLDLAPIGVVVAFAAWFLVASRLRSAGPENFFELLEATEDGEAPGIPQE